MKTENYIQDFYVGDIIEFTEEAVNSCSFGTGLKMGMTATVIEVERGNFGTYPSKLVILDGILKGKFQWVDEDTVSKEDIFCINFATWFDKIY